MYLSLLWFFLNLISFFNDRFISFIAISNTAPNQCILNYFYFFSLFITTTIFSMLSRYFLIIESPKIKTISTKRNGTQKFLYWKQARHRNGNPNTKPNRNEHQNRVDQLEWHEERQIEERWWNGRNQSITFNHRQSTSTLKI